MKRTGPTNEYVRELISELKRVSSIEDTPLWKCVAEDLELPRRNKRAVNLSTIQRVAHEHETVVVPGKVLGAGVIHAKLTIAALGFSKSAEQRIAEAKGTAITIADLVKHNPKGTNVRLLG